MFESTNAAADESEITIRPSIYLDYGVDGASGEDAACEICERGMRFKSRWQFELEAILNVAFSFAEGSPRKVEAEGMVIDCSPSGEGEYLTTLAFLDPPPELGATLGEVSARLDSRPSRRGRTLKQSENLSTGL